ncbi:MAG: hypothetical protein ACM3JB_06005 [Acidobacteriaceae bacterium]
MTRVFVKNGTPVSSQSLCMTCEYAHVMRGFRESEELVYCYFATPMFLVPFSVRDCNDHSDRNRPTWEQMEKLAIEVRPTKRSKEVGFAKQTESDESKEDDVVAPNAVSL